MRHLKLVGEAFCLKDRRCLVEKMKEDWTGNETREVLKASATLGLMPMNRWTGREVLPASCLCNSKVMVQ